MGSENTFKKTIEIFMMDGDSNGRLACEISNWSGKVYKIPRTNLKDSSDLENLKNTGVYLLLGKSSLNSSKSIAYIGEGDDVFKRLKEHLQDADKEFWNTAIVGISKDNNLNKAHVKYLESLLYNEAKDANRFELYNNNIPGEPSISDPEKEFLREFSYNLKISVNALGYKIFDKLKEEKTKSEYFYNSGPRDAEARGQATGEGFVVFEGSKMADSTVDSVSDRIVQLRKRLLEEGIVSKKSYEFREDYLFSSPSAASDVVLGRSSNGLTEWKLKDGTTLKEYESPED